ncbi:hypothetical protein [Owenweeksia hongkongensis]|uniref:DUF7222 domain-containing protein n=1 Tax=Owenweeksia hongkongensis TaxID=253245 RepID=UPI003A8D1A70
MALTTEQIIPLLSEIIENNPNSIEAKVAIEARDYHEDIPAFFTDLLQYGCVSGLVSSFIYTRHTHQFFDEHYIEIENIRCDLEESLVQPIQIKGELKNFFAWLAFEETARKIANDIGLEL